MNARTFILEIILPLTILPTVFWILSVYRKIKYPQPLVIGCIIPKVCAVVYNEIVAYCNRMETEKGLSGKLGREARKNHFIVNWGYLREQALNTKLFLRALLFEKSKIEQKPGLKYAQRETLIWELIEEVTELRWKQVRWQVILLLRGKLGLRISKAMLLELLKEYKTIEEEMIAFVSMEDNCYRDMLMERLGLVNWGLINGDGPEPA